ncbi:MAG: PstS family phosphate ABC transporter substrate-binding protein [Opitutales bacterium]
MFVIRTNLAAALRATLVLALAAGAGFLRAAEVTCASAESMDGLMRAWTAGFTALHPDTPAHITLRAKFSADFAAPLTDGMVQVAPFARELFPAELAQFTARAGAAPLVVPVATGSRATKGGTHAIVFFVNARNPLAHLSLTQLREVWSGDGRLTTWGQLGLTGAWAHRRITLHGMRVRRASGNPPGIVNYLSWRLLAGRAWRDDIHEYTDTPGGVQSLEQIVRAVADDETALGYSGFAYAAPGAKPLALAETDAGPFFAGTAAEIARGNYPLTRTLYLCTGPNPDAATRAFLHYVLSPDAQRMIGADPEQFFPLAPRALAGALIAADPTYPAYRPQPVAVPPGAPYVTPDGAVAIVGYNDMQGLMEALDARFARAHPGLRFALSLQGTKTAPAALARGTSAFAPMGAEFTPAQLKDYLAVTGRPPLVFRVAHDSVGDRALSGPLAIIVHRDNPLADLSLADVADIFSGRATRGLHPGGLFPDLALGLSLRERTGLGDHFGPGFKGFKQSAEVVAWVAQDPRAIGFAAVNRVTPGVKVLAIAPDRASAPVALTAENVRAGRYPLDRFLLICARQPLEPFVREYLRFVLSREGQAIIATDALGYLPLNPAEAAAERTRLAP